MSEGRHRGQEVAIQQPTGDQWDDLNAIERLRASWRPIAAFFSGLSVLMLCSTPAAWVLAGENTTVDLSLTVSLALSVSFVGVAAVLGTLLALSRSKARHHKRRARALEQKNQDLRGKNEQLSSRVRELERGE